MSNTTGIDKAREQAEKIRADVESNKEASMAEIKQELAQVQLDPALLALYQENAGVGAENLGGNSPILKVHSTGRSTKNDLADGSEPQDGFFYYRPTKEQFEVVECHILTISRGYRAEGMEGKKDVFHQLLGGMLVMEGRMEPFIMYFTGLRLSRLWEFGKIAASYTRAKPFPIPMFALKVRLMTEKVAHNYGKSWVINFHLVKSEQGQPEVVTDPGLFTFLRDSVELIETQINTLIGTNAVDEIEDAEDIRNTTYPAKVPQYAPEPDLKDEVVKDVSLDDIPF